MSARQAGGGSGKADMQQMTNQMYLRSAEIKVLAKCAGIAEAGSRWVVMWVISSWGVKRGAMLRA